MSDFRPMKDTTLLTLQICFVSIGLFLLYLGAFVFTNKAEVQYVMPTVMTGLGICLVPTLLLPIIFDIQSTDSRTIC